MAVELMEHQEAVLDQLKSGKVLYGGTGSGKSITALAWYMKEDNLEGAPIYVITTAKKRDTLDWEREAMLFGIGTEENGTVAGILTVDSWNNIAKYTDIKDAVFIFDEQRVVGKGAWVKSFLKIAKKNRWLLLSATPGDEWKDYAPVFIANGFYQSFQDFNDKHVVFEPFIKFPKIRKYVGITKLEFLRNDVLVEMPYEKLTVRNLNYLDVGYDDGLLRTVYKDRWNFYDDVPVQNAEEMWRLMRRVVNSDPSRMELVHKLLMCHPKLVVFYNFDYELEILRTLKAHVLVREYNGHYHDPTPTEDRWVYLVQYMAGAEGWNCTETDAMVFYSLTYSYKMWEQCQGRIDRIDTKFHMLYYYIFVSNSIVDRAIRRKLGTKQNFNERKFLNEWDRFMEVEAEFVESCQI